MGVHQDQAIRGFTHIMKVLKRNRIDGNIRMKADRNIKKVRAALNTKPDDEPYLTCVRRALSTIDDDYADNNYDNARQVDAFHARQKRTRRSSSNEVRLQYVGDDEELEVSTYMEQKPRKQRGSKRRRT